MKDLRVGVVGVGHIGSNHARLYAEIPSAEFTAVYDVDQITNRTIATKFKATPAKSLDELLLQYDETTYVSKDYRESMDQAGTRAADLAARGLPPEMDEWLETLASAWRFTKRLLVVSALIGDSSSDQKRGVTFNDGILTRRNTFQRYFAQQELQSYIESGGEG